MDRIGGQWISFYLVMWKPSSRGPAQDRKVLGSWRSHSPKPPTNIVHSPTCAHMEDKEFQTKILFLWATVFWQLFVIALLPVPYVTQIHQDLLGLRLLYHYSVFCGVILRFHMVASPRHPGLLRMYMTLLAISLVSHYTIQGKRESTSEFPGKLPPHSDWTNNEEMSTLLIPGVKRMWWAMLA